MRESTSSVFAAPLTLRATLTGFSSAVAGAKTAPGEVASAASACLLLQQHQREGAEAARERLPQERASRLPDVGQRRHLL